MTQIVVLDLLGVLAFCVCVLVSLRRNPLRGEPGTDRRDAPVSHGDHEDKPPDQLADRLTEGILGTTPVLPMNSPKEPKQLRRIRRPNRRPSKPVSRSGGA